MAAVAGVVYAPRSSLSSGDLRQGRGAVTFHSEGACDDLIPAAAFGQVQRGIGAPDEIICGEFCVGRKCCNTATDRDKAAIRIRMGNL